MLNENTLHSVGVTVRDLEATMAKLGQLLGIDRWEVAEVDAERMVDAVHRGRRTRSASYRSATGTTTLRPDLVGRVEGRSRFPFRTVTFELVQPLGGETVFKEFLARRGPGISHVVVNEGPGGDCEATTAHFASEGVATAAEWTVDGERRRLFDTRSALGGFLTEVRPAGARTPGQALDVHDRYERPAGVAPLPVIGVSHFGVVVDDLMAALPEYHRLYGCQTFPVKNWRTCLGSLDSPHFRGESVDHEYFTGMGTCGDFQFEVIEPTFGPSDYNVGFRDRRGPGVHHLLLYVTGVAEEWQEATAAMTSMGHPPHMGSDLTGGAAEFCYFDTASAIGFAVEGVWGGKSATPPDPAWVEPYFTVDFADLLSD